MSGDNEARKLRLLLAVTEAVKESELPWPEYGYAIAAALTNIVGNPISVCVREAGTALEFDGQGQMFGRVENEPPGWFRQSPR